MFFVRRRQRGGVLRLVSNANGMPLYVLPAARMPCARFNTCSEPIRPNTPPKRPFVFLAHLPHAPSRSAMPTRPFAIRLPADLRPGRYKVFVWCKTCGGSLLVAGSDASGQTLRILRPPSLKGL
jgi:hypothetical protein